MKEFHDLVQESWSTQNIADNPTELHLKLQNLRKAIINWKKERIGDINSQEETCKVSIFWLDKQKESRTLTSLEKLLMNELAERYKQIALIKETIWRRRAKRQWIAGGDKNTSYFHSVASVQKRQNIIHTLQKDQEMHHKHEGKAKKSYLNSFVI
jgi:hypothetical protein